MTAPAPRYLHPKCWECGKPKGVKTSHCESPLCPWCQHCADHPGTKRNLKRT